MSWWPKLRPHQLDALRRIADGQQPITSREPALATTVYALRTRRLVTTPRSGGVWTAVITDAGRYYLDHGEYVGSTAGGTASTRSSTPRRTRQSRQAAASAQAPMEVAGVPGPEELIRRLQQEGTLSVPDPPERERAAWRRVVHAVRSKGLVPEGFHLRHHGRDDGDLVVELVAGPHPGERYWKEATVPVPVPEVADDDVPIVRELRRHQDRLQVSDGCVHRALRLVQALASAAEQRGYSLALAEGGSPGFLIQAGGRGYPLLMSEEYDTVDAPDAEDIDDPKLYSWQRIPTRPQLVPSGRLVLELVDNAYRYSGRRRRWADRQRWRLEDKLGDVLAEVRARVDSDEQARRAAEQAKAERRQQWEQAMDRARARFIEEYRAKALDDQLAGWRRAREIRQYAAELKSTDPSGKMADELTEWIGWMLSYADALDPLLPTLYPPVPPEPSAEDLRPYLKGWSPRGPESAY